MADAQRIPKRATVRFLKTLKRDPAPEIYVFVFINLQEAMTSS